MLTVVNSICCYLGTGKYALFNKLRAVTKVIKQFGVLGSKIERKPKVFCHCELWTVCTMGITGSSVWAGV